MSVRCLAAWVASTSDSNEPGTESPGSAKPIPGAGASSPITGPESPATPTFEVWGWADELLSEPTEETMGTLRIATGVGAPPPMLTFCVAASPAKTSVSPDVGAGLIEGGRSSLFFECARVADELLRPGGWLLLENVPGLLSSNGGRDYAVLLATLADLGFHDLAWRRYAAMGDAVTVNVAEWIGHRLALYGEHPALAPVGDNS